VIAGPIGTLSANRCNFDTFTFVVARTIMNSIMAAHHGGDIIYPFGPGLPGMVRPSSTPKGTKKARSMRPYA
jgi:hypothetical protein